MTAEEITERSTALARLIEEKLGVKGRTLEAKLRRAGRLLPRWVRREAAVLVRAEQTAGHPKLMRVTGDPQLLETAYARCVKWLDTVDPVERRKTAILGLLATNAMNLLIISGAFIAWLVWSGHL